MNKKEMSGPVLLNSSTVALLHGGIWTMAIVPWLWYLFSRKYCEISTAIAVLYCCAAEFEQISTFRDPYNIAQHIVMCKMLLITLLMPHEP